MKKLLLPLVILWMSVNLIAQPKLNRCGTFDLIQYKEQQEPGYLARVNACFDNAKRIADAAKGNRAAGDTIYRIQTVFHIVYTSPDEDIPDSVIYSQVQVLNEDFRRRNADTASTRDIFKPVAGDARMEFYLATVDPDGNPTTGITRTQGNPGFFGFDPFSDNVKSNASGGKNPWPTDRYLNVWVCNVLMGFGVLGYAFPPDNAPNWPNGSTTDSAKQGVVLHFPVVGKNFSAPIDPSVDGGRSLTHELGHYFGLRHIWGDGDCSEDDGISDTPESDAAHQQTCDTTVNSCVDSPNDYPDMIENFMDYSDDRCLNMFTNEQIGIMRAMLQTSRAGIATLQVETAIASIEENFKKIDLFPNPTQGLLNLHVELKNTTSYDVEVLDAMGQKIYSQVNITGGIRSSVVDLSNHPSGIYFVKLIAEGQSATRKFCLTK